MRSASLFIPGEYEDAFIYMGKLLAVTLEGTIRVFDLNEVVEHIENTMPLTRPIPRLLFLNNELLPSYALATLRENPGVDHALRSAFDQFPTPYYEVNTRMIEFAEEDIPVDRGSLLDLLVYNRRVYLGADTGFFHVDYDWESSLPHSMSPSVKRFDAGCVALSAGMGIVNASCAEEGLFTAIGEFWSNGHASLSRAAERSMRTAWFGYHLLNYANGGIPQLLRTKWERDTGRVEGETRRVVELESDPQSVGSVIGHLMDRYQLTPNDAQYVHNSGLTIFLHTFEGSFYAAHCRFQGGRRLIEQYSETYKGPGVRVLSVHPIRSGSIIETDDRVLGFATGEWIRLFEGEPVALRTFPRSRHYRDIVAITAEDGILLTAVTDTFDNVYGLR